MRGNAGGNNFRSTFVLSVGVKHHQAGRRQQAERLYREILRVNPNHPDALHLLGVIGNETGNQEMAVENIGRAIALRPDIAEFHNNLGNALQAQGRIEPAIDSFHRALQLMPGYATAHNNLGNALKTMGDLDGQLAVVIAIEVDATTVLGGRVAVDRQLRQVRFGIREDTTAQNLPGIVGPGRVQDMPQLVHHHGQQVHLAIGVTESPSDRATENYPQSRDRLQVVCLQ